MPKVGAITLCMYGLSFAVSIVLEKAFRSVKGSQSLWVSLIYIDFRSLKENISDRVIMFFKDSTRMLYI